MQINPSSSSTPEPSMFYIYAGKLFDPVSRTIKSQQLIQVDTTTGLIQDVVPFTAMETGSGDGVRVLDCRDMTIVPGFVDAHVHLFLHPYSETSWNDQLTKETLVERTVRATNHAKRTLMAGFTTVRDLGTEGAGDADIALRKCISQGLIPGPRYYCANRAIVSTGSYGPKSSMHVNQEGIEGITGAEAADGVDDCIKVARRQIGAGADWIKIYADYRVLSRLSDSSSSALSRLSLVTFSPAELETLINTTHALRSPSNGKPLIRAAAHATNYTTIKTVLSLGIDSVEHGMDMFGFPQTKYKSIGRDDQRRVEEIAHLYDKSGTTWVPTLAAYYTLQNSSNDRRGDLSNWERGKRTFEAALPYMSGDRPVGTPRIRVAVGGDTGVFAHGDNALEMKLMVRLGADWRDVLKWATIGGWGCITGNDPESIDEIDIEESGDVLFGAIRPGWAADIVGLAADPDDIEDDVEWFESFVDREVGVKFVMKAGKVYRWGGKELL